MKFLLEIDCDNAAFQPEPLDAVDEIAAVLRDLAESVQAAELRPSYRLRAANGNTVGRAWTEE